MTQPRLVLATSNAGKVVELTAMLENTFIVEARPDGLAETVEDAETLELNAIKKASEVAVFSRQTSLADDSGLFVDALGGEPGVLTARYAGPQCSPGDNIDKMLREMQDVERPDRTATFRTVIAVVSAEGETVLAEGSVAGQIATQRRGTAGFGYDPIFVPEEGPGLTFAEMMPEAKRQLSHRARALEAILDKLSPASF